MRINYVVAFYIVNGLDHNGTTRGNSYHGIDSFFAVKSQLNALNKFAVPDIAKVTFVFNKDEHSCVQDGDVEQVVQDYCEKHRIEKFKNELPIEIKYRNNNIGWSYGAWEYHMRQSLNEGYDYYFLNEDDYVPACDNFYLPFHQKLTSNSNEKIAFSCGLGRGSTNECHPAVSYGLYSVNACRDVLDKHGEIFDSYNKKVETNYAVYDDWQGYYHRHFLRQGYAFEDTIDLVPTVFRTMVFGNRGKPMLLPIP